MVKMQSFFFESVWVQDFVQKRSKQKKIKANDSNYTIYVMIGDFVIVELS